MRRSFHLPGVDILRSQQGHTRTLVLLNLSGQFVLRTQWLVKWIKQMNALLGIARRVYGVQRPLFSLLLASLLLSS